MIKKITTWFLRKYRHNTASRWIIFAIDIFTLIISFAVTDLFRLHMAAHIDWASLALKLCAFIALASICYISVGTHRSIIRHSGLYDIYKVVLSNSIATIVLCEK